MNNTIYSNGSHATKQLVPAQANPLAELLLSNTHVTTLPPLSEVVSAVGLLAAGTRRKALLPIGSSTSEIAFERRGTQLLVSCYETGGLPDVHQLDHAVSLPDVVNACGEMVRRHLECADTVVMRAEARRLSHRLANMNVCPIPDATKECRRQGGMHRVGEPLSFGFDVKLVVGPTHEVTSRRSSRADLHALLFPGTLWGWVHGKRVELTKGPVLLAVHRMVAMTRNILSAWIDGRQTSSRMCSGGFQVAAKLDANAKVTLRMGSTDTPTTISDLTVRDAVMPILRITSDLLKTLTTTDRSQSRNLSVAGLRSEVRALRKLFRQHERRQGFTCVDPDHARHIADRREPTQKVESVESSTAGLRYSERWRVDLEGLDATSTFLCGDRIIVGTPTHTVALERDTGTVLWARPSQGHTILMLGAVLVRFSLDGEVEICDLQDGEPTATAQLGSQHSMVPSGIIASSPGGPVMAVLTLDSRRLVAIDTASGDTKWRFAADENLLEPIRVGRMVLVASENGSLHAIDSISGEELWHFAERTRFAHRPVVCGNTVVVAGGTRGRAALYGIDLFSGAKSFEVPLAGTPQARAIVGDSSIYVSVAEADGVNLCSFSADGEFRWSVKDVGVGLGASALVVDGVLVVNSPSGRVYGLASTDGSVLWEKTVSNPISDDIPRCLEPVLRAGGLFVPSASINVLHAADGKSVGQPLPCDLVPDVIRVDERGWVFAGEESGHLVALAPIPQLRLIRGGV